VFLSQLAHVTDPEQKRKIIGAAFYDVGRGPQGGRKVIVFHQDAEQVIDTKVAGLIVGAWQTPP
jgi:GMP synthase PP-ATPase subunit